MWSVFAHFDSNCTDTELSRVTECPKIWKFEEKKIHLEKALHKFGAFLDNRCQSSFCVGCEKSFETKKMLLDIYTMIHIRTLRGLVFKFNRKVAWSFSC